MEIEEKQRRYFEYTLHEIPYGVLYNQNGATSEECSKLLNELKSYEILCEEFKINRIELIEKCRFYYNAYKEYLCVSKEYHGFSDYLDRVSKTDD